MNTFKKLTVAAATAAAVGWFSAPANAVMEGVLGEAHLVPLAMYGDVGDSNSTVGIDTYVAIKAPDFVGIDAIPNRYTAPNTTSSTTHQFQKDVNFSKQCQKGIVFVPCDTMHWFWFDPRSVKQQDGQFDLTANDLYIFDWRQIAGDVDAFRNRPGYLVFTTEEATSGAAANFATFADAQLVFTDDNQSDHWALRIPVLAMSDGDDANHASVPEIGNEVLYNASIPTAVSPLASGMRIANGDGDSLDQMRFMLNLGVREDDDNLLVVWLDDNYTQNASVTFNVYSENEDRCSGSAPLDHELNLIWIEDSGSEDGSTTPPVPSNPTSSNGWHLMNMAPGGGGSGFMIHNTGFERVADHRPVSVCVPGGLAISIDDWIDQNGDNSAYPTDQRGIIEFLLPEGNDVTGLGGGNGGASASGVTFSITMNSSAINYNANSLLDDNPGGLNNGGGDIHFTVLSIGSDQGKEDK